MQNNELKEFNLFQSYTKTPLALKQETKQKHKFIQSEDEHNLYVTFVSNRANFHPNFLYSNFTYEFWCHMSNQETDDLKHGEKDKYYKTNCYIAQSYKPISLSVKLDNKCKLIFNKHDAPTKHIVNPYKPFYNLVDHCSKLGNNDYKPVYLLFNNSKYLSTAVSVQVVKDPYPHKEQARVTIKFIVDLTSKINELELCPDKVEKIQFLVELDCYFSYSSIIKISKNNIVLRQESGNNLKLKLPQDYKMIASFAEKLDSCINVSYCNMQLVLKKPVKDYNPNFYNKQGNYLYQDDNMQLSEKLFGEIPFEKNEFYKLVDKCKNAISSEQYNAASQECIGEIAPTMD